MGKWHGTVTWNSSIGKWHGKVTWDSGMRQRHMTLEGESSMGQRYGTVAYGTAVREIGMGTVKGNWHKEVVEHWHVTLA
jgi:hypothetical protein